MSRKRLQSPLEGHEDFVITHTRKETAKVFGVNYDHVNNFCNRHGLRPVPERKGYELKDEVVEYLKNHTVASTSAKFNLPYSWLSAKVRRDNIPYAMVKGKVATLNSHSCKRGGEAHDMIRALSNIFTYSSIARVFGYTKERIRQICMQEAEE